MRAIAPSQGAQPRSVRCVQAKRAPGYPSSLCQRATSQGPTSGTFSSPWGIAIPCLSAAAISTSSACASVSSAPKANSTGTRTNTLIAQREDQRTRASPRASRQKRRETHVERPACDGSDARREQSLKEAVQDPTCKDDDQPAIEPSRAELHVHGPGSSAGRLSMTVIRCGFMRLHVSVECRELQAASPSSHPRAKKRRYESHAKACAGRSPKRNVAVPSPLMTGVRLRAVGPRCRAAQRSGLTLEPGGSRGGKGSRQNSHRKQTFR